MSISITPISFGRFAYSYETPDSEYEYVKQLLMQAGMVPSGNKEADMKTFTMLQAGAAANKPLEQTEEEKPYLPWGELMGQLGLTPTGDWQSDYAQIIDTLTELIQSASSDYERQYYQDLADTVDDLFMQTPDSKISQNGTVDYMSASNMVGELNKLMLVSSKSKN